jgi:dihydropyrimidinase
LLEAGKREPQWHWNSRPPVVEAEGVHHLLTFAGLVGARTYIVHTTCRAALEEAARARKRGVDVLLETCTQYLLLDRSYAELPDFEGAKYVVSPPLRDPADQDALWKALADGTVATVATDHAPTDFAGQKTMGRDDFTKIPGGVPGIENRVPLLYTHGVTQGRLSLERFVEVASTAPARIFGLYPRKGAIREGSDADLVVYDPEWEGKISAARHAMNVDYSAYEGWPVKGRAEVVTVRGRIAVQGGEFSGEIGRGRFVPRRPEELP